MIKPSQNVEDALICMGFYKKAEIVEVPQADGFYVETPKTPTDEQVARLARAATCKDLGTNCDSGVRLAEVTKDNKDNTYIFFVKKYTSLPFIP